MLLSYRWITCVLLLLSTSARAQDPLINSAQPIEPPKLTDKEKKHREALVLYAKAVTFQKRNELTKAVRVLEKALELEPDSTTLRKSLIPLYLAIGRRDDALAMCRDVLKRAPDDYETWHRYASRLVAAGKEKEARAALEKGVASPLLKDDAYKHAVMLDDLGLLYEQAKLYANAEATFRKEVAILDVLQRDASRLTEQTVQQQRAETHQRIGEMALKNGKPEPALAAFEESRKLDPTRSLRFYLNLAEVFASQKKHEKALQYLNAYLARQPAEMQGYELKIKLLERMNRKADVLKELQVHANADERNEALHLLLARELVKASKTVAAENVYFQLINHSPSEDAYRGLFTMYRKRGKAGLEKILSKLDSAIKIPAQPVPPPEAPSDAAKARAMLLVLRKDATLTKAILEQAHEQLLRGNSLAPRTQMILGVLALRSRQLDMAEALYRGCLDREGKVRRDVGRRNFIELEQSVYAGLLDVLRWRGKHEEIIKLCKSGLEHAAVTNRVLFYLEKSRAQSLLERHDEAIKSAKDAVEHSSDLNRLLCERALAQALSYAGKHDEAVAKCKALFKDYKQDKDVRSIRHVLSTVYSNAGKKDKSEEMLQAMLETDPSDATAHNDLGYQWADRNKNLEEAERMIRKAIALDKSERTSGLSVDVDSDQDNAAFIDSLGWVLFRRGKVKEALEQLEKAVELPDGKIDPVLWDHLGDVHARLKQKDKALRCWQKALQLYDARRRPKIDGRYEDINSKIKFFRQGPD